MKITVGQITIEGSDVNEINALIALIPQLQAFQPANVAVQPAKVLPAGSTFTAEQVEQAKQAVAKGYSFEASYKVITGSERFRRTSEETIAGMNAEQAALARLEAIASGDSQGAEQAATVPAQKTEDLDLAE